MQLFRLKLRNFRNYRDAEVELGPGLTIITGTNGAGKTNLLEAVQYALCGRSFRTSREGEMAAEGAPFMRLEADVESGGTEFSRSVTFERGAQARVDSGGGAHWMEAGAALCFSPDDLQLIKGPPAVRRRFLDEGIIRRRPAHHHLTLEYQKVLAQRNSFLGRARAGLVPLADIVPWDRQLAAMSLDIYAARLQHCRMLAPHFQSAWSEIAGEEVSAEIDYESQIEAAASAPDPEEEVLGALRDGWSSDMDRVSTGTGTHRDEVRFLFEGRALRQFGSQGEQRATVLALLMAARSLAREEGGPLPLLLLDDVMSELDPDRRRRLMLLLYGEGQAIITAADADLFSGQELEGAVVLEVVSGAVSAGARYRV